MKIALLSDVQEFDKCLWMAYSRECTYRGVIVVSTLRHSARRITHQCVWARHFSHRLAYERLKQYTRRLTDLSNLQHRPPDYCQFTTRSEHFSYLRSEFCQQQLSLLSWRFAPFCLTPAAVPEVHFPPAVMERRIVAPLSLIIAKCRNYFPPEDPEPL